MVIMSIRIQPFLRHLAGVLVALALIAPAVGADPAAATRPSTRKILNGDRLRVNIVEAPELSRVYAVAGDGTIDIDLIGRIPVAELTSEEAAAKVSGLLEKDYFKKATVSIDVSEFVEGNILILGEVKNPGPIAFKSDTILTLFEAISQAGGLTPAAAGKEVRILRWKPGGGMERQVLKADVQAMLNSLNFQDDQFMRPRDIVLVPHLGQGEGGGEFLTLGEVGQPGFHVYEKGLDIIRAISAAGGFTRYANMPAARILRPDGRGQYTVIPVDMGRLFNGAEMQLNVPVLLGDILFVPSLEQAANGRVYLLGEVAAPGAYPLPADKNGTLARTILAYGGLQQFARGSEVKLIRFAPDGSRQTIEVNVEKILKTGDFGSDIPLKNEDVIVVPAKVLGM